MRRCLWLACLTLLASGCAGQGTRQQIGQPAWGYLAPRPPSAGPVDFVLVEKAARRLVLYAQGQPVRVFSGIALGGDPTGPKHFEGDGRTPEGRYVLDYRNPRSAYHLSLHVSYPDSRDRAFAAQRRRSPGDDIFLHGQPNGMAGTPLRGDWTDGCVALSDPEIEEIWTRVADGTPIEIRP